MMKRIGVAKWLINWMVFLRTSFEDKKKTRKRSAQSTKVARPIAITNPPIEVINCSSIHKLPCSKHPSVKPLHHGKGKVLERKVLLSDLHSRFLSRSLLTSWTHSIHVCKKQHNIELGHFFHGSCQCVSVFWWNTYVFVDNIYVCEVGRPPAQ